MSEYSGPDPSPAMPTLLRRINERRIVDALACDGAMSRAALVRATGISAPTVSKAVVSLSRAGLLEERRSDARATGRPAPHYALARDRSMVVGVSIRPDRCRLVVNGVDPRAPFQHQDAWPTPAKPHTLVRTLADRIARIAAGERKRRLLGVGIAVPCCVHPRTGQALDAHHPLASLLHGNPARQLTDRIGAPVLIEHEATALCRAERWFNLDKRLAHFAVLTVGDGVSVRLCSGGHTRCSPLGRGGRLGALPIHPDLHDGRGPAPLLAHVIADDAFARSVARHAGENHLDPAAAARRVRDALDGNGSAPFDAQRLLDRLAMHLGFAVAAVIELFDPEAVFVHGQVFDASDDLLPRIGDAAAKHADPRPLHRSLAEVSHGSLAVIIDHLAGQDIL